MVEVGEPQENGALDRTASLLAHLAPQCVEERLSGFAAPARQDVRPVPVSKNDDSSWGGEQPAN